MVFVLDTYSVFVTVDITPSVSCVQANVSLKLNKTTHILITDQPDKGLIKI